MSAVFRSKIEMNLEVEVNIFSGTKMGDRIYGMVIYFFVHLFIYGMNYNKSYALKTQTSIENIKTCS